MNDPTATAPTAKPEADETVSAETGGKVAARDADLRVQDADRASDFELHARAAARRSAAQAQMIETLRAGALKRFRVETDFARCVTPLLVFLGWKGDERRVAEALPHFADQLDLVGLRNTMANLNYRSNPLRRMSLADIDPRLMPCLFVPDNRAALVLRKRDPAGIHLFDSGDDDFKVVDPENIEGTVYVFEQIEPVDLREQQRMGWVRSVVQRFRPLVFQAAVMTALLYVLALATPLFIMAVYDRVIATGSHETLVYLGIGVSIALVCDLLLRTLRSRVMGYVGARLDNIIGTAIFEHILHLPTALTERATIGAQVARLKDFESVREFFAGQLAQVFLEFPFVLILVATVAILGGWLAFIPLVMAAMYGLIAYLVAPVIRDRVAAASQAASKRQEFLVETVAQMRALKYTAAEETWTDRYRVLSAASAMANYKMANLTSAIMTTAHVLMIFSGVAVMAAGTWRVMEQTMSIGALVAIMILVWRVLAPIQQAFMTQSRFEQVRSSIKQIDNLMNIKVERDPRMIAPPLPEFVGDVSFNRVSLRYSPEADPALVGVTFDVAQGELVAVTGRNGAGKSTLLKLIQGLYTPQAGNIRIDGIDIRQMDPFEVRNKVGYVPQDVHTFFGTIAQNLEMAQPTASQAEVEQAARLAHMYDDIMAMDDGFATRIGDQRSGHMPQGLQARLLLARAMLRDSNIYLFDEAVDALDRKGDEAFQDLINRVRGKATIFMVTHRPSYMRMADRLLYLESGHLRYNGNPGDVLDRLMKDYLV